MVATVVIGSYTTPDAAMIRRVEIDTGRVEIRELASLAGVGDPIYFALDSGRGILYAVQSQAPDANRATSGALAAYALGSGGAIDHRIDLMPLPFSVPCHVSLSHDGTCLLFAEYSAAHAGVIALNPDGSFGASAIVHHEGHGPNAVRQESAHCHCAVASPDDSVMFVCDLGTDTVNAYDLAGFNASGALSPLPDADFHCAPRLGPRHLVFNPAGDRAYLIYELGNAVQSFAWGGGRLKPLQAPLSTLPADFGGETKCAAIRISPCGKWLLASNRGHDSIAAFRIQPDGTLGGDPVVSPLTGRFPRDFEFVAPDCLVVGHKLSDNVGLYRFDAATGAIARLGATLEMPRPLAFVVVK